MTTMTRQRSIAQIKAHIAACEARYSGYLAAADRALRIGDLLGAEQAKEHAAEAQSDLTDARTLLAVRVSETLKGRVWMP